MSKSHDSLKMLYGKIILNLLVFTLVAFLMGYNNRAGDGFELGLTIFGVGMLSFLPRGIAESTLNLSTKILIIATTIAVVLLGSYLILGPGNPNKVLWIFTVTSLLASLFFLRKSLMDTRE